MKSIDRKISVGVLWNLAGLLFSKGARTLFLLFLAQLLAPEAFGLVAMCSVIFELANAFVNSGLGAALIRSKEVSRADLSTVFFSNLLLSIVAYAVIYISAPFVADFYSQPELVSLVRVMGLVVLINATKVVQVAILSRNMNFKYQMKANSFAVLVSGGMALIAAMQGLGVWSLVVQMLVSAVVSASVLWFASRWLPTLEFNAESFKRLFGFGKNLLAEGLQDILFQNSFVMVIGRFFSAEITGLYYFARKISSLLSQQLTSAVQQATYPALSTLQDENEKLLIKYRQIMQLMMFVISPVMGLLAGLAPILFEIFFDERWQGAVPYLQILCVVGALYPLHALNINLLNVKGRSDLILKIGILKRVVSIALLIMSIPYGVVGIVCSQVVSSFFALIPNTYFSARLVNYSLRSQIIDAVKPLLASLAAGYIAFLLAKTNFSYALLTVIIAGFSGCMVYVVLCWCLRAEGGRIVWDKLSANN